MPLNDHVQTTLDSATLPAALPDLDAALAPAEAGQPDSERAEAVRRVARVRENDPRIMHFERLRLGKRHKDMTARERRDYAVASTRASRARALLRRRPELVAWYAAREALAVVGLDPAGAGPSPRTPEGRDLARRRAADALAEQERERVYLMTCELPDPTMIRPGERSPEAAAERQAAAAERKRIEAFRAAEARKQAGQQRHALALDNPKASPTERRIARSHAAWHVRVQEDELFMAMNDLRVRCHTHTQQRVMLARIHTATA